MHFRNFFVVIITALVCTVAFAQQTGSISGRVSSTDGDALPGVTVEARSNVLPQPRVVETSVTGEYRMPALPPGRYTITFSLAGMQTRTRDVQVLLNQESAVNMQLGIGALAETITVMAETSLIDPTSTEIKSAITAEVFDNLPVAQEYRDLIKLIPAVQYTEMETRGPSAGGSGQDNTYQMDGVNVTWPLFGTLSAEPSTHDIQQISEVRGGAKAIDFNRSGGFLIDSVSKSGTSEYRGQVSYQFQNSSMIADPKRTVVLQGDTTRSWVNANLGGPILPDRLFFFASYYLPEVERENPSNAYGEIPDFLRTRNEYFGKLTFTPTANILLHGSYRDSDREGRGEEVGSFAAPTRAVSDDANWRTGVLEGSWITTPRSYATFKISDFLHETVSNPDFRVPVTPSLAAGTRLDVNNLDRMGGLSVPTPVSGNEAFNAFIAPIIEKYGFLDPATGARRGGGVVGGFFQINDQDFFRENWQVGYNHTLGAAITHDLHVGYQRYKDGEDLTRVSNGWGSITVTGGRSNCPAGTACAGQPVFFTSRIIRGTLGEFPLRTIHSEAVIENIELNDTIRWGNWSVNVGAVVSNDTLFGQGLRDDPSTLSGYVLAPGSKYKMYEIPWEKQIQPRLGATWAYNGEDNVYVSYAKYNPPASSLPRAASWDRNTIGLFYDVFFDADGNLMGFREVGSSSGKLFVPDLDPRYVDEYLIGTAQQVTSRWTGRFYARHRYSSNFWEDTNNTARVNFQPPDGIPRTPYIPNLNDQRSQICLSNRTACPGTLSGSSYVIAMLDGAFTKYYEATLESDWRGARTTLRGSYTWSQYYGNMDQDNTTTGNDGNIFIGSSFIADGAGRQIWDNKYGWLKGDRRHILKVYGTYQLPWNASTGAYAVYQSGEPWEAWSYVPYSHLTGSTSDVNRYAEPAGSRRGSDHYLLDLNYTQSFPVSAYTLQLDLDIYNVFDNQTGFNIQPAMQSAGFGQPRNFYSPRRFQVAARFRF